MKNNDLQMLSDEAIARLAQEGSGTAYEYLINKYRELAKIKSKAYYISGGDKEDVIQEGMIGIFKAVRDFDEERDASFRTFAELCIARQISNAIKGANRQKHQILNESIPFHMEEDRDAAASGVCIAHFTSNRPETDPESMMLVKETLDYLKENDRDLFSMMERRVWNEMLKGKTQQEIALTLNQPAKAVDNAIRRIKKKIEFHLKL